jgi:hypothetical protein
VWTVGGGHLGKQRRPLFVLHDLFNERVTDLAWTTGSTQLYAASIDGSVACFTFDRADTGTPMTNSQMVCGGRRVCEFALSFCPNCCDYYITTSSKTNFFFSVAPHSWTVQHYAAEICDEWNEWTCRER